MSSTLVPEVLVVDDDGQFLALVAKFLRANGYRVHTARNGPEMAQALRHAAIDLVVLDWMLPGKNGLDLCRDLRRTSSIPVIMLTAKGEETDRIIGLEVGADDYLPKPFNPREVIARVKAALRRRSWDRSVDGEPDVTPVTVGNVTLNPAGRDLVVDGEPVRLRQREFDLLEAFLRRPNVVLDRERLLRLVWGQEYGGDTRTIDVHVAWLRDKLRRADARIETVWGVGYKLVPATADA